MCLQDLQLARAELLEIHEFTTSSATNIQLLPSNPQRVRMLCLGPTTGSYTIRVNAPQTQYSIGQIAVSQSIRDRVFDILHMGDAIQSPIFASVSAAMTFFVYEYSLPFDPESLQRLAAKGKW